jgi:protein-tyrosine phosphatase
MMSGMRLPQLTDARSFRVLFVCTGNICRSPFAEILTRHLLIGSLGEQAAAAFDVSSAGIQAVAGSQMHPDSREQLRPWGLDGAAADRFTARQLHPTTAEKADLVLGATPWHRSVIITQRPSALATTFSIREFARLAGTVDLSTLPIEPVVRARVLVDLARRNRALSHRPGPDDDDIPDPMGHPPRAHKDAALLIGAAVQVIVDVLAPSGHRSGRPPATPQP